ncbi:Crp/Fnr family transcriptional regulator [Candidatus Methylospira mobilis]|uniref:Crp/Fnr family transcriptional regulator n=1 Tax=Candidatus Methylospira mobilis TaxID=1808979 RepID=A0A5Q0BK52_9GAMM|nr:Crp/Fnr family transcriptional regulator [Candidatus Methylospira mobilis]QFY43502.1 Crp/Fnr family transcriptional regulator [Candidatus Methylospira mobilis]WNV03958.1 Crp/Fnr family transcriptional regulator [Candidatus Methylospira mobilis]
MQKLIPATNLLLGALSRKDREPLLANCEQVDFIFADVLYRTGDLITHVYFPTESFISLVTSIDDKASLEVGLIGSEGVLGVTLILGIDIAPFQALVQGAGTALRITAALFLHELEQNPALRREMRHYLYASISQLAQRAACTRFHMVEARLACWLLMTHDRAHSDTFLVTQLFMAYMLGVRRVGVTKAANSLRKQKLISYCRGAITILDHAGLEAASCACYRAEKEGYERIMGYSSNSIF